MIKRLFLDSNICSIRARHGENTTDRTKGVPMIELLQVLLIAYVFWALLIAPIRGTAQPVPRRVRRE